MLGRNEGNAFPDERRHDGDDELVSRVLVEEGPDDLTSPDRLGDESDADRHRWITVLLEVTHGQTRPGQATLGRTTRRRCLHDALAARTAQLGPNSAPPS